MIKDGEVKKVDSDGVWIRVDLTEKDLQTLVTYKPNVLVEFNDGRLISTAQRKKAYVLINAISSWSGYTPIDSIKATTKYMFEATGYKINGDMFSLSDCSMEEARLYITWLIDFCITNQIPCGEPLWKLAEDIPKYVYACLMSKTCAVCGKKADLHHCHGGRVGMGGNRNKVNHLGRPCLPLCRKHHTECHYGEVDFLKRYILEPIKIDERIASLYKLSVNKNI